MKQSNLFIIMLTLLFPLAGIGQNQATIVDDVYFKPSDAKNTISGDQTISTKQKPNYKNGAKEIVFTERTVYKPTAIHDTVYVVGQAGDKISNTRKQTTNIKTDPSIIHDTIYVTENAMGEAIDSLKGNQEQGHYLNGFNGTESDLEYAERIRRFHNPKYTIFIGSPAYNDIYFLNNNDWNVYVDDSYAYVTPTWTNPYWWDYNYSPYSYSGFGWGLGFGFGWNNYPWSFYGGFGSYYGYDGLYGYGYPYYGFGGYYGYGGGYGNWYGGGRNRNDEGARREISNYNGSARLGGRQAASTSTMIGSSSAISRGTNTTGSTRNSVTSTGTTRSYTSSRTVANPASGIGLVRSGGARSSVISNGISSSRSNNFNINTRPRTYSTTVTATPNESYSSRQSSVGYSNRTSYTSNSGSRTVISNSSSAPSRSSYSSGNYSNTSRSSSPSYSSGSSRGSYSSGSSSVSSGGSTRGSGSSGGGRR